MIRNIEERNTIVVSKELRNDIPVILVDFDKVNLEFEDELTLALEVIKNLNSSYNGTIYHTCFDNNPIDEASHYQTLEYWGKNKGLDLIEDLAAMECIPKEVQLCGIYRELCIVEVASILKRSYLPIEPIIIDNDDYTISATCSVSEGDTLENRINECGFSIQYL